MRESKKLDVGSDGNRPSGWGRRRTPPARRDSYCVARHAANSDGEVVDMNPYDSENRNYWLEALCITVMVVGFLYVGTL